MQSTSNGSSKVFPYWWVGRPNWGDLLTPHLLERYAGLRCEWRPAHETNLLCVGSVIGHVAPDTYYGAILGSGKMYDMTGVPHYARVYALRGPITARGVAGDYALGDPGLIADTLVSAPRRLHKLGLLPHWSDAGLTRRSEFLKDDPLIIDPAEHPLKVIAAIGSCEKLVTSSLHGMILADALGIPRQFESFGRLAAEGGFLKHRDYTQSIGMEFEPGVMKEADPHNVNMRRNELIDAFDAYGREVRTGVV